MPHYQHWPDFCQEVRHISGDLVALDHGSVRVGMAVNPWQTSLVLPWLITSPDIADIVTAFNTRTNPIRGVIVGLPINMDGTEGKQCQVVRSFMGNLRRKIPHIAMTTLDERLSSSSVHTTNITTHNDRKNSSRKRSKKHAPEHIDSHSAGVILQCALNLLTLQNNNDNTSGETIERY